MKAFLIEVIDEKFWAIGTSEAHVEEILRDLEDIPTDETMVMHELSDSEMELVLISENEDMELPSSNLFEVFSNYQGKGEIVCSTAWVD